jgi:hypothetical protein
MSFGMRTAWTALTTVRSANAELDANWYTGRPPRENGRPGRPMACRHIVGRPRSHSAHVPQLASVDRATWSPAATCVTPAPTSSTTPAPSCPSTTGAGKGIVPSITDRSLWHSPAADTATSTSPGPGSRTSRSSTTSARFPSNSTPRITSPIPWAVWAVRARARR